MYITNLPVVFIWLGFAIRARSLFFFSTVNPVIETGGVLGESKINILERLPAHTIPKTIFIEKDPSSDSSIKKQKLTNILQSIEKKGIQFPLIAKPNVGERGFLVEKIKDPKGLASYVERIPVDFIIQDFIDYPIEISLLYHRMPAGGKAKVTSVCIKKNLSVIGDGVSTIKELMQAYPRARFQLPRFQKDFPALLDQVLPKEKELELEPIGNHCRGTTFLNGNQYIDEELETVFDDIGQQMHGIYYGRFDMKCQSMELLKEGKGFKVLEFNGVAGEPAHIYDPSYRVLQAYKDIFQHWKIIYQISQQQRSKGVASMTWKEAYNSVGDYIQYMRSLKSTT